MVKPHVHSFIRINLPLSILTAGKPQINVSVVLKVLDEDVQQILR
jgi:hypothetical protein